MFNITENTTWEEYASYLQSNWHPYRTNSNINLNTKMNKLTSMLKRLLDADSQILYKANFIDSNLELTSEGIKELLAITFDIYKDMFVQRAKEKIREEKEIPE